MTVLAEDGRCWRLTEEVGRGGEGQVYAVAGQPELVAKIVPHPIDGPQHRRRIERLVGHRRQPRTTRLLDGSLGTVAWPLLAVRTRRGELGGYLMTNLRPRYRPLDHLLDAGARAEHFPAADWATALRAAARLAALLALAHEAEYLLGDLKPDNVWVDAEGYVALSDLDSWQFTDREELFASRMRSPGYTAPERITDPEGPLTAAADDFVLAVLVHQLLLADLHPFHGTPADGGPYHSKDDNLLHGRCHLTDPRSLLRPAQLPPADLLPGAVRDRLRAAFGPTGRADPQSRPTAADWAGALAAELAPERLWRCPANRRHVYTAERAWCPWCDLARAGRPQYREDTPAPDHPAGPLADSAAAPTPVLAPGPGPASRRMR
ncbi:hypothetical protein CFP65_1402 [Kitasatospora sp. MMS16-BH015]|uniref:protein kinase domain-containing protein n=1 Tax=Kitasatospora sp. MMS16-BH015 TaxID=2018025 RepID=UPI000CA389AE|nr:hypothetical protein [Kitasatospora sp. MMS16-BH015]AUG76301.1 hypothetical protein CFP65_1402 [Kitasatospora sp. MMS16-BH015]